MVKAYGLAQKYDKACKLLTAWRVMIDVAIALSYKFWLALTCRQSKTLSEEDARAGLVSDCISYCAVISSFVKLDVIVYGVLINTFADAGSVKAALGYVDAMKRAGLNIPAASIIRFCPDAYSSNCMTDLYSEQSMIKQTEKIFESLKKKKKKKRGNTNEFTFAMMLCMYKRLGRFEEVTQIAKQMRDLGLLTDLLSYNNVLGLYALDGRFKAAVGNFKEVVEASVQPDDCTFKSLGIVLVKCGISKKAVGKLEATRNNYQISIVSSLHCSGCR
uniref:Pentacotripeptide-repeat region of PRORP domain-containing protein n=1 Tax=Salix viminalis TaxID=40686 RepID=A0A6N2LEP9_SALVM